VRGEVILTAAPPSGFSPSSAAACRPACDQGRLAGPVLAEQDVDLSGIEVEADTGVGDDPGNRLVTCEPRRPWA